MNWRKLDTSSSFNNIIGHLYYDINFYNEIMMK